MTIDREGFRAWLAMQGPDLFVGHLWTSTDCALSHYHNESRGSGWTGGCCGVEIGHQAGRLRETLPASAWTFLERIDRLRAIDLTSLATEDEERAMAKARHPSNAARRGEADTA